MQASGMADIKNVDDMTPEEFKKVVDFLIEQKKAGQFRVIWNSFQQAVDLLVNKRSMSWIVGSLSSSSPSPRESTRSTPILACGSGHPNDLTFGNRR
jgi:hypothetical protein